MLLVRQKNGSRLVHRHAVHRLQAYVLHDGGNVHHLQFPAGVRVQLPQVEGLSAAGWGFRFAVRLRGNIELLPYPQLPVPAQNRTHVPDGGLSSLHRRLVLRQGFRLPAVQRNPAEDRRRVLRRHGQVPDALSIGTAALQLPGFHRQGHFLQAVIGRCLEGQVRQFLLPISASRQSKGQRQRQQGRRQAIYAFVHGLFLPAYFIFILPALPAVS